MQPNVLAIRIQPDEGISLKFDSKVPGPTVRTAPVTMEFRYATSFGAEPPEAYERLLLETMLGDSTLFARRDEVETAWAWLDPLLNAWARRSARRRSCIRRNVGPGGGRRLSSATGASGGGRERDIDRIDARTSASTSTPSRRVSSELWRGQKDGEDAVTRAALWNVVAHTSTSESHADRQRNARPRQRVGAAAHDRRPLESGRRGRAVVVDQRELPPDRRRQTGLFRGDQPSSPAATASIACRRSSMRC